MMALTTIMAFQYLFIRAPVYMADMTGVWARLPGREDGAKSMPARFDCAEPRGGRAGESDCKGAWKEGEFE